MGVKQFTKEKVNQHPEQQEAVQRVLDIIYEYEFSNVTAIGVLEMAKVNIIGQVQFSED